MKKVTDTFNRQPRVHLGHLPTPLELMPNLGRAIGSARLYIKRDDCTGLGTGGNKVRQLEFYLGQAIVEGADTVLITGAVQSNFTRTTAAAARKLGLDCHIQAEQRVPHGSSLYYHSGNMLLSRLFGAYLYNFPEGEDESGADRQLDSIAAGLLAEGKVPYVIHLGQGHPSFGALGYVDAAREIILQAQQGGQNFDEIIVASGSGATHAGLLFGLRVLGDMTPIKGICVRRDKTAQLPRVERHCQSLAALLEIKNPVQADDIQLNDEVLSPGYGKINDAVLEAIELTAHHEGILLDPVYTGRSMAGFLQRARASKVGEHLLFIHTGGQASLFAYEKDLAPILSAKAAKAKY